MCEWIFLPWHCSLFSHLISALCVPYSGTNVCLPLRILWLCTKNRFYWSSAHSNTKVLFYDVMLLWKATAFVGGCLAKKWKITKKNEKNERICFAHHVHTFQVEWCWKKCTSTFDHIKGTHTHTRSIHTKMRGYCWFCIIIIYQYGWPDFAWPARSPNIPTSTTEIAQHSLFIPLFQPSSRLWREIL